MKTTVSYCIDEQLVEKIRQAAKRDNRSVSNYVENVILRHFEKEFKDGERKYPSDK